MEQTTTLEDFVEQLICKDAFDGLRSNHAIMRTITEELEAIHKDDRTHHQLAADPNFSIIRLYPVPIAMAIKTIAISQGWCAECLAGCLLSNMGFLEHHQTRIRLSDKALHSIPHVKDPETEVEKKLSGGRPYVAERHQSKEMAEAQVQSTGSLFSRENKISLRV